MFLSKHDGTEMCLGRGQTRSFLSFLVHHSSIGYVTNGIVSMMVLQNK